MSIASHLPEIPQPKELKMTLNGMMAATALEPAVVEAVISM